jgi:hypothetical protein
VVSVYCVDSGDTNYSIESRVVCNHHSWESASKTSPLASSSKKIPSASAFRHPASPFGTGAFWTWYQSGSPQFRTRLLLPHRHFFSSGTRPSTQSTFSIYLEYHSVCPLVRIETPHPISRKQMCPPRNQRGRGQTQRRMLSLNI